MHHTVLNDFRVGSKEKSSKCPARLSMIFSMGCRSKVVRLHLNTSGVRQSAHTCAVHKHTCTPTPTPTPTCLHLHLKTSTYICSHRGAATQRVQRLTRNMQQTHTNTLTLSSQSFSTAEKSVKQRMHHVFFMSLIIVIV